MTAVAQRAGVGQKFRFFTAAVKAFERANPDTNEKELVIEGIASSNTRDRYGDTMTAQCQTSLLTQSKKLTMFGNHDYDVPEDVYGRCGESHLETEGDILKLAITMIIAQSNPRAVKAWELINKDGVTLGFSIGGIITDAEIDAENDDGSSWWPPLLINDLELVEISLVGIPANRDSYTRSFLEDIKKSAFKSATRDPGVQKAFLRSIGVKGIEGEFPDLRDAAAVNAELAARGVLLESSETNSDGSRLGVNCKHDTPCKSFEAHFALDPKASDPVEVEVPDQECSITIEANGKTFSFTLDVNKDLKDEIERMKTELKAFLSDVEAGLATVTASIADAEQKLSASNAEITTKKTELETLTKQRDELKVEVAKLAATPTGRQTHAATDGSSGATNVPLAKMSEPELRKELERRQSVKAGGADARAFGETDPKDGA